MEVLWIFLGLPALVALILFWPSITLRRALAQPFPASHAAILARHIPFWREMAPPLQMQLKRLVKQFLHQKKFIGCDGLTVTDEMRVAIAGQACMLLLNRKTGVYPSLRHILLYPSAFVVPRTEFGVGGVVTHASQTLAGESWNDGRVILAWDHVQQAAFEREPAHNVVWHEFAHQLDSESGHTNGAPLLPSKNAYRYWSSIMAHEFERLQQEAEWEIPGVIDHYGASNPAEFFAVATETFFGRPLEMAEQHPALFELLQKYYRVDPRAWRGLA
ncbi:MAG: zinc-dependent peptidase [Burkholderiales bacterium]|nr:zinc-dependent peptidase [Burkholderiales bacterium]